MTTSMRMLQLKTRSWDTSTSQRTYQPSKSGMKVDQGRARILNDWDDLEDYHEQYDEDTPATHPKNKQPLLLTHNT